MNPAMISVGVLPPKDACHPPHGVDEMRHQELYVSGVGSRTRVCWWSGLARTTWGKSGSPKFFHPAARRA